MRKSEILQKDHEDLLLLYKRMKPEERLMAYFHHSQLIAQVYQAGIKYRLESHHHSGKIFTNK